MGETPNSNPEEQEPESEFNRLADEVKKAIENAPPEEEFLERQKVMSKATKKFLKKEEITGEEKKIIENISGQVEFPDFEVMEDILCGQFGFDYEAFAKFVEHERAHFDTAKQEGLEPKILIKFFKSADGKSIRFAPAVKIKLEKDRENLAESFKKVAQAPDRLSQSDREIIE